MSSYKIYFVSKNVHKAKEINSIIQSITTGRIEVESVKYSITEGQTDNIDTISVNTTAYPIYPIPHARPITIAKNIFKISENRE